MKVTIKELTDRKARLLIEETAPHFVNSIRRVLLAEVPKLAIQHVVLYDNNSGLFDEMIAHRLGLLPVPTDPDAFNFRDACVCGGQGCPNCTVRFTLSKEGPGTVYSEDLQPENPKFAIADPKIPVLELLKGQRVILEAEAVLGRGREHAKWQPVHGVGYSYVVTLKGGKAAEEAIRGVVKACPIDSPRVARGKFEIEDASGHVSLCAACLDGVERAGVPVRHDDTRFVFGFETDGSLTARQALLKAIEILKASVEELETKATKVKLVEAEA